MFLTNSYIGLRQKDSTTMFEVKEKEEYLFILADQK